MGDQVINTRWNLHNLPRTREECIEWLKQEHLLLSEKICRVHHRPMVIDGPIGVVGRFRCTRNHSCRKWCVAKGTFFENCRLPLERAIGLMYAFSQDWTHDIARRELVDLTVPVEEKHLLGPDTIHFWYKYCRDTVVEYITKLHASEEKLGRPGTVVQVDESLFGHRKYERGRKLDGKWVFGMIQDGTENVRMFAVQHRDSDTLISLIKQNIKVGTEIHSDSWKSYDRLETEGYIHKKVNQSDPDHRFVAPDRTHTQRIEATWRPAKDWFRSRHYGEGQFEEFLNQYLRLRHCKKNGVDSFISLLDAIRSSSSYRRLGIRVE